MQNNMLMMTYNPTTGTNTPQLIPMQPITIVYQQNIQLPTRVASKTGKTSQIQRTLRQKPHTPIKLMILDDEELQDTTKEQDIIEEQKEERKLTKHRRNTQNKIPQLPDSATRRKMKPYVRNGDVTLRIRKGDETVARNILTLPEYQQRKKEILRSGASVERCEKTNNSPKSCDTQFNNIVKMNGAIVFAELNFNIVR